MNASCIFCKITKKEIPARVVAENADVIAIWDIAPKTPIHYLIIPKMHTEHFATLPPENTTIITSMTDIVRQLAQSLPQPIAFNVVINNGAAAGQSVMHFHWHFLAGRNIYAGGGLCL